VAAEFGSVQLAVAQTASMLAWTVAEPGVWQGAEVIIPAGTYGQLTGDTGNSPAAHDPLVEVVFDVPGRGAIQTYVYESELEERLA
jgi:hypothetical protein